MTSEMLAFLGSVIVTAAVVAWSSQMLFRDYREGFRMLYHWAPTDVATPSDVEPRESKKGMGIQIVFVGTALLIAVVAFVALNRLFG